jgi:hypothetical protein
MLDGNMDMKNSVITQHLSNLNFREAILSKYGTNRPSTLTRNKLRIPIDGIWVSSELQILQGGYFPFDGLINNTDHHCFWIDISYHQAFGHNKPPIVKPSMRRLHCRDPRIVENYTRRYTIMKPWML